MVNAYVASGNYRRRPGRGGALPRTRPRCIPSCRSCEARIRFASGDVEPRRGPAPHRARHGGAAGLPAVPGDAHRRLRYRGRGQCLRLPGRPRQRGEGARPGRPGAPRGGRSSPAGNVARAPRRESWRRVVLGELYAGGGRCPRRPSGRSGRARPKPGGWRTPDKRKHLVHSGATAAIGLFTGPAADSTALVGVPGDDRRAALARRFAPCSRSAGATPPARGGLWRSRTRLDAGRNADVDTSSTAARCGPGVLPPGRLPDDAPRAAGLRARAPQHRRLRFPVGHAGPGPAAAGAAYERLGRRAEARAEYRQVLAQWKRRRPRRSSRS